MMMERIKYECKLIFTALMFYTRVPCPRWVGFSETQLRESVRYLPVVGWFVGSVSATVIWLASYFFSIELSIALSMIVSLFITGAFHEDGLADVCDGFGGGWTRESILTIMKDSRIGTYGSVSLISVLGLKFLLLRDLFNNVTAESFSLIGWVFCVMICAHGLSRWMAITMIISHDYVRENETSKSKPVVKDGLRWASFSTWLAALFAHIPLLFLWLFPISSSLMELVGKLSLLLLLMYITKVLMARFFRKWIGGYTGDCLGAIQQVTELVFYLGLVALC